MIAITLAVSIHAPRGRSDVGQGARGVICPVCFNPRSPWEERRDCGGDRSWSESFNPRSPWEERHVNDLLVFTGFNWFQSTLPVGGATSGTSQYLTSTEVSIHAPRGRSDHHRSRTRASHVAFQSTLPVGGATGGVTTKCAIVASFNPRSPWEERPVRYIGPDISRRVSIHAPRGRSDLSDT